MMRITNVHERTVPMPADQAGRLLDALASREDRLWPSDRWPAMRFDAGGIAVGARGGHGPIRYDVLAHDPGRTVRFRFRDMPGFDGEHAFEVTPAGPGHSVLRHVLTAEARGAMALRWRAVVERLHDALVEDALDRAEGRPPRPHDRRVRLARAVLGRL